MTPTPECSHAEQRLIATWPYAGGVAVHPYTEENPAAHGGVCDVHECLACGARRRRNVNGRHSEVSPWGRTRAVRQAEWQGAWARANGAFEDAAAIDVEIEGQVVRLSLDATSQVIADVELETLRRAFAAAPERWRLAAMVARTAYLDADRLPEPGDPRSY